MCQKKEQRESNPSEAAMTEEKRAPSVGHSEPQSDREDSSCVPEGNIVSRMPRTGKTTGCRDVGGHACAHRCYYHMGSIYTSM